MTTKISLPGQVRATIICPQVRRLGSLVEMGHGYDWQTPQRLQHPILGCGLEKGLGRAQVSCIFRA